MDLKSAKSCLESEVLETSTDIQKPLACKYAKWKIIDYLWASHLSGENDGECLEWLKNLYQNAGMTEENLGGLIHESELIIETIRRTPLEKQ